MKTLLIKGASFHGCVVADAAHGWQLEGFIDAAHGKPEALQFGPLLGRPDELPRLLAKHAAKDIFVAVGDNAMRKAAVGRIRAMNLGLRFPAIIHPRAIVCQGAEIGEGAVICAGAVVGVGAKVGAFTIVNTRASLDHHSVLGDYASMAPASATGGNVRIGEGTAIGMGVMIHHGVEVGKWTVVGSCSLVNKDLADGILAIGCPARVIRTRAHDERYL